eukprot:gene44768-59764_t
MKRGMVAAPGCFDCITARSIERAGFEAVYMTGAGTAASLGYPDYGLCFSARKLDKGIQHALDVTTSRTLMGHAYSMPGLHAKYYDQDWEPLVEVIQDTVGRHDAFAMACASKYYDEIGYPGHANCSDNFNGALGQHGIDARPGWMAVNLFFNTAIDAHG